MPHFYVHVLGSNKISKSLPNAHEGGVFSLCMTKDGSLLSGGGRDRKIIEWDTDLQRTGYEIEVSTNEILF